MNSLIIAQVLWSSIAMSTFYVLFSVAFTLYLKVTTFWNFSQAGLISVAFIALYFFGRDLALPVWMALAGTLTIVLLFGAAIERYGFSILRRRSAPHLTYFIFTFMLAQFLIFACTLIFGTEPHSLAQSLFASSYRVAGVSMTDWDFRALAVTGFLLLVLYGFLNHTRAGQMIIAVADNAPLTELYRIRTQSVYMMTMVICGILIVVGTWLYGSRSTFVPATSLDLILIAIIATILGGSRSVFGAALAALFLGVLKGFSIFVIPSIWQNTLVYYLLFAIIIVFPGGIAGALRKVFAQRIKPAEMPPTLGTQKE